MKVNIPLNPEPNTNYSSGEPQIPVGHPRLGAGLGMSRGER